MHDWPHATLQLQMQPDTCDLVHADSVICSLHLRQAAALGAVGQQKDPHTGAQQLQAPTEGQVQAVPRVDDCIGCP